MNVIEKLEILADAAKYDVACTSSGVQRAGKAGQLGAATQAGCCHSFTPDGRCVTLLKVLMTNVCVYDCAYCVNRCSNEGRRAAFTPQELADLTIASAFTVATISRGCSSPRASPDAPTAPPSS